MVLVHHHPFKLKVETIAKKIDSRKPSRGTSWDVYTGVTGATAVAPKFSDTLTLSQPWGADFAHHRRGRF